MGTLLKQGWLAAGVLLLMPVCAGAANQTLSVTNSMLSLKLSNLVELVLQRNESLQGKLLSVQINRHKYLAEKGVFEPTAFASAERDVNKRQNNTEQASSLNNIPVLLETNDLYSGGLESLMPSGGKIRLGYNLTDLRNNIPPVSPAIQGDQWQTFFGLTLDQPLLKNFGYAASMAGIRVAALSSKIAFQEYRRQLMTLVSTTEATYWNLYFAQEQVHSLEESVKTAETILRDNRARLDAGRGSELEVLEARAGLGLRQAKLQEAKQKQLEAVDRVLSLYADVASSSNLTLYAADIPHLAADLPDYQDLGHKVFDLNPDYLIQVQKAQQERVRLGYAKNQRLPELELKSAYGMNGLGVTPENSWDNVSHGHYPSWSAGLELRVPVGGGAKTRHELRAAELQVQSADLELHSLRTELLNGIDSAWHKAQTARGSMESYQESVKYNESLLASALARLDAGKIESRKVLEIEADLLDARNSVTESLVRYKIARLELEVLQGATLQKRNLELTQAQLEDATRRFGGAHLNNAQYLQGLRDVQQSYEQNGESLLNGEPLDTPSQRLSRQRLRELEQQEEIGK